MYENHSFSSFDEDFSKRFNTSPHFFLYFFTFSLPHPLTFFMTLFFIH